MERDGHLLLQKADKKANSTSWFSTSNKYDEAYDLYKSAAVQFTRADRFKEAGDALLKAAQMKIQLNEQMSAVVELKEAASRFKRISVEDAITAYDRAARILDEEGKFYEKAKILEEIGKIYESELVDLERAMNTYDEAAKMYNRAEKTANESKCNVKVATFAAMLENYEDAATLFREAALRAVTDDLAKWSAKEYFLKATLCRIAANDIVGARDSIPEYCNADFMFESTREYRFLLDILDSVDNGDLEAFTNVVAAFDALSRLDNWKTSILLRIKRSLQAEPALT